MRGDGTTLIFLSLCIIKIYLTSILLNFLLLTRDAGRQMRSFITSNDVPVGYETPTFPSLHWPTGLRTTVHVLYDVHSIWRFTLYWSLIFNVGFYAVAGLWASLMHRKQAGGFWIMAVYLAYGGVQGVAGGTITGFLIGNIYSSGLFAMSTWIPLCCAAVQILFDFAVSFSGTGIIM